MGWVGRGVEDYEQTDHLLEATIYNITPHHIVLVLARMHNRQSVLLSIIAQHTFYFIYLCLPVLFRQYSAYFL